jgi:hypothetical protein
VNEPRKKSVLFLLKQGDYGNGYRPRGGLFTSARLVAEMLERAGVRVGLRHCIDGNDIDREVTAFKPDVCVIEALWVTPEKAQQNARLHPDTLFVVRIHSEIQFLSSEGIAIQWLKEYGPVVNIAVNSERADRDLGYALGLDSILLPNYYPTPDKAPRRAEVADGGYLFVGCFGALRPLKNNLAQAIAALEYAAQVDRRLVFGVNIAAADPQILKNMRALFKGRSDGASLYELGWLDHADFVETLGVCEVVMQCSQSETFCITAADAAALGIPIVVSPEVRWASRYSQVDPNDVDAMVRGLDRALTWNRRGRLLERLNLARLRKTSERAKATWLRFLSSAVSGTGSAA